ncbi:unnamed protein product [Ectocarpus sp. 12 AP-2014]
MYSPPGFLPSRRALSSSSTPYSGMVSRIRECPSSLPVSTSSMRSNGCWVISRQRSSCCWPSPLSDQYNSSRSPPWPDAPNPALESRLSLGPCRRGSLALLSNPPPPSRGRRPS